MGTGPGVELPSGEHPLAADERRREHQMLGAALVAVGAFLLTLPMPAFAIFDGADGSGIETALREANSEGVVIGGRAGYVALAVLLPVLAATVADLLRLRRGRAPRWWGIRLGGAGAIAAAFLLVALPQQQEVDAVTLPGTVIACTAFFALLVVVILERAASRRSWAAAAIVAVAASVTTLLLVARDEPSRVASAAASVVSFDGTSTWPIQAHQARGMGSWVACAWIVATGVAVVMAGAVRRREVPANRSASGG